MNGTLGGSVPRGAAEALCRTEGNPCIPVCLDCLDCEPFPWDNQPRPTAAQRVRELTAEVRMLREQLLPTKGEKP